MGREQDELRELMREAHGLIKDLRGEIKTARGLLAELVEGFATVARLALQHHSAGFEEAVGERIGRQLDELHAEGQKLLDKVQDLHHQADAAGVMISIGPQRSVPPVPPGMEEMNMRTGARRRRPR